MFEVRRIKMFLFPMLVLQFTAAAASRQLVLSFTVRAGQEVTLSCESVIDDQQNCNSTTWLFSHSTQRAAVEMIIHGQIRENAKSDRLSVTQNCSLVIKKVTDEDAGRYFCQQWKSGQRQEPDSRVSLSVVTMTEHRTSDQVTLKCSVSPYDDRCPHTVKWLYAGNNVDKDHKDLQTSQSVCSASVRLQSSHFISKSNSDFLKCEVTDGNKVQQFPFRLQPSGEKPGDNTRTTTERSIEGGTITTASPFSDALGKLKDWWWLCIIVAVFLVALVITAVKVIRCRRAKGNNARMNDDVGLISNSTVAQSAPGTSQDTADPEGGVSYASVTYTKKPNSEGRVRTKNQDDEGDAVTYMTVKVSQQPLR